MPFRGIKSRLFLQFWILFFLVLLLNELLIFFIFLEISTSRTTGHKRQLLEHICSLSPWDKYQNHYDRLDEIGLILSETDHIGFVLSSASGEQMQWPADTPEALGRAIRQTFSDGVPLSLRIGKTFGLLFPQAESLVLTTPILREGQSIGAGGIETSLAPIYQDFRRFQKITLVFITICSFFFALVGHRQLMRIYFRPLKRLAKKAETYHDEEKLLFSVRKEDDEFSILSISLNKMLNRIAENKATLQQHIESLQVANAELKKAQRDIIRAEKMATVGRLTSGLAHEIGNPIGIVLGYLDLLKQEDLSAGERNDFINRSEAEITRINHIIRQLLDMSRSCPTEIKPLSVHLLLQELVEVFRYQPLAANIHFETDFRANSDLILADPDQIRQVFLNIILNAIDAVNSAYNDHGEIKVSTENTVDSSAHNPQAHRKMLKITVKDNGQGIPAAILSRLFDPFFTTKAPGKGTGLGLSVSFMIVEQLGGDISAASVADRGAMFHVTLPLSASPSPS